jgi:hypothetical protein
MKKLACSLMGITIAASTATAQLVQGPSSSQTPYVQPSITGFKATSILTAGDSVNGYRMAGIPDGLGAFDNGNGTFTLLMNHELGATLGSVHAHGSTGAFVSKWVISKSTLSVISGSDLMQNVKLWNTATSSYVTYNAGNPSTLAAFSRFCSADLPAPSAFYNSATGKGTQERIYMNGEESGTNGRAMGHIVTGPNGGTSYELPRLGKMSIENAVANPATGDKTVVALMDDATPGQVYFYVGTKQNTGNEIEKAGLTNGNLYSIAVSGMLTESSTSFAGPNTSFTTVNLGNVENMTGTQIETASNTAGITRFLRPEDGAWDPSHPEDFYFNTTNSITGPSRVWRVHFSNLNDLTQGGTITPVLDGTEGQKMLDNMAIDKYGHIILLEDVGNDARNGRVWQYDIATDQMIEIARHDSTRFEAGGSKFLTIDEETSGVIDVQDILGTGWFLCVDQAHYPLPSPMVEGGQLFAFFNPATYDAACAGFTANITVSPSTPVPGQLQNTIYLGYGPSTVTLTAGAPTTYAPLSYNWSPVAGTASSVSVSPTTTTNYSITVMNSIGCTTSASQTINVMDIRDGDRKVFICHNGNTLSVATSSVLAHLSNVGDKLGNCPNTARMGNVAETESFTVLPNPATGDAALRISLTEGKQVAVSISDMQGRKVMDVTNAAYAAGNYTLAIPSATLNAGIYFVSINAGGEQTQIRFVISR